MKATPSPRRKDGRSATPTGRWEERSSELIAGKSADQLVFGDGTSHLLIPASRKGCFTVAVREARAADPTMPRVTPHDLRHTAASLAVQAGAHVTSIQRMLGRAPAAMTLDVYADLFDGDVDTAVIALDRARHKSSVVILLSNEKDREA